jgi:hypothetical protein
MYWSDEDIQWVDVNDYQWWQSSVLVGLTSQIWADSTYVYVTTSSGFSIVEIESEQKYAQLTYSGGFTTVYSDDDKVYLGTNNNGIKYINKTCISGSIISPIELASCLNDYVEQPLTSNEIRYIHGNNEFLMCCTSVGVDVIKKEPHGYRSYTTTSGAKKCFMTSTGKCYYSTLSGTSWKLNRVNISLTDWATPDYVYGDPLIASNEITDMFVTEATASDGVSNTLMVTTVSGTWVVDEGDYSLKTYYTHPGILAGTSNHFTSIWAYGNKMYVASSDAFSVVNLTTGSLIDCYTQTLGGNNNEPLIGNDIVDINANM